jgi:hypothetical protein
MLDPACPIETANAASVSASQCAKFLDMALSPRSNYPTPAPGIALSLRLRQPAGQTQPYHKRLILNAVGSGIL